jgi:hypothetical protein
MVKRNASVEVSPGEVQQIGGEKGEQDDSSAAQTGCGRIGFYNGCRVGGGMQ